VSFVLGNARSLAVPMSFVRTACAIGIILALSIQLVRTKLERARLLTEIQSNVHEFVQGTPLPDVQVRDSAGRLTQLTGKCDGRPLVVMITQDRCIPCALLTPIWSTVAARRRDLRFVLIYSYGPPRTMVLRDPNVDVMSASPSELASVAHIHGAPAIMAADKQCHLFSAGAGVSASKAVLELLSPPDVR